MSLFVLAPTLPDIRYPSPFLARSSRWDYQVRVDHKTLVRYLPCSTAIFFAL